MSYFLGCVCDCSEGQDPRLATVLSGHSRRATLLEKCLEIEQAKDETIKKKKEKKKAER